MFYILLMLILILPTLAGIGVLTNQISNQVPKGITISIISGILGVTLCWTIIAFWFPLSLGIEFSTLIIGIASFFYFKVYNTFWNFLKVNYALFLPVFILIVFFGSYFPFILDHFGYYVPTIKWLSQIGLVQGISNLDLLLGQMSLWHIFQAGFSNFSDPFLRLNVLVLVLYLIYIFEEKSWIHLVFLPFLFLFSQSPSTDLPVIVFSLIILNEVFNSNKKAGHLLALSIFVFAIKPTMIWVPIFVFLYGTLLLKMNLKHTLPGIFILMLFFLKNFWTFGFPIFPVQVIDLGLSWRPNAFLLQNSSEIAIMKTYDMQYEYSEIQQFSTFDYIKNWFFLNGMKGKIHLLFILSMVGFFAFAIFKKSQLIGLLFISILVKSVLILIFSAQYRFFFDVFFVIIFVPFYQLIPKKLSLMIFASLSIFFLGFLSFPNLVKTYLPSFKLGNFMTGFTKDQFMEPAHYEYAKYKTYELGNLKFNVVNGYIFTFDTPLPAISPQFIQEDLDAGIFPQLKGKTLKEGFIWRKISEDEKENLKLILKDFQ